MVSGFGEIAERLRRSTVQIRSDGQGSGSGIVWDSSGTVITNAHVTRGRHVQVELWDGREVRATLKTEDRVRDVAALEIAASNVQPAEHGDSDRLRPGALVIAVGNPLGFFGAVTRGVVHGIGPAPGLGRQAWIQAAIRLAPGNSGGPLADAEGRVVGVNTMIHSGLGLAVPLSAVARFLRRGGGGTRLGVTVRPVHYGPGIGLLVLEVERGSAADRASLLQGDVLLGIEGRALRLADDLAEAVASGCGLVRINFARPGSAAVRTVAVRMSSGALAA
jgi:serine protease Do